jgi:phosphatidate cytidylyltransferase
MLKQRIITALILAPLALWGIWALPAQGFAVAIAILFSLAAWEWSRLSGLAQVAGRGAYVALVILAMAGLYPLLGEGNWPQVILLLALMWWTFALMSVLGYPQSSGLWRRSAVARGIAGLLVMVPAWAALVLLHATFGPGYVILLMLIIWGADSGAYFAGRAFGRHKLAPRVSPGKTWEGVAGGALLAVAVALLGTLWLEPVGGIAAFSALVVVTVMISVLGDLMESLFKRVVDIKDSGGLLPGHGGVMDRVDSMTAAAPLFTLGLLWLSR